MPDTETQEPERDDIKIVLLREAVVIVTKMLDELSGPNWAEAVKRYKLDTPNGRQSLPNRS